MAFGDKDPEVLPGDQPVARNNSKILMAAVSVAVLVSGGLAAKTYFAQQEQTEEPEKGINVYSPQSGGFRQTYKTGYAQEPKPEPKLEAKAEPEAARPEVRLVQPTVVQQQVQARPKPTSGVFGEVVAEVPRAERRGRPGSAGGAMPGSLGAPSSEYRPGMSDGHDRLDPNAVQGLSAQKNRWLASAGNNGPDYVTAPWQPAISPNIIQSGQIIPAVTLTAINSDLPGDVVAMIQSPVCDTPTGEDMLIPPTARLYGRYNDQLAFAQERAQVAWYRILFPDGSSQNIGSMAAVDSMGASGIEGNVDTHPWGMAAAIAGAGFFSILGQTGQIVSGAQGGGQQAVGVGIMGAGADGTGQAARSVGNEMIMRQLNRPNTLTIKPGTAINVLVSKDIALPVYQGQSCR